MNQAGVDATTHAIPDRNCYCAYYPLQPRNHARKIHTRGIKRIHLKVQTFNCTNHLHMFQHISIHPYFAMRS